MAGNLRSWGKGGRALGLERFRVGGYASQDYSVTGTWRGQSTFLPEFHLNLTNAMPGFQVAGSTEEAESVALCT